MAEEVKVFRSWSSPYPLRVMWALSIKGVKYETVLEDLQKKSPSLLQYNPVHKKVPVLLHNGKAICESLVILEYIEDTWKQNPLLPQDPYERAMARFWAKFSDEQLTESLKKVLQTQGKAQEEALVPALKNLKFVEGLLEGKKFFGGETIGYLDIAFGWMANLISILEEVSGQKMVDPQEFPLLTEWIKNFSNAPVIKGHFPPRDKIVAKFQAAREKHLSANEPEC